ncbi:MAG: alpha/beta hydrolase [Flavipsychrobacter sp.]|nr:alpha/beta hydrolase [Flavipsychrobacter sp.]
MQRTGIYVLRGDEELHYIVMGTGKKLLLTFHGYSNNATLFIPFEKYLGREYTILSFDLPYHGSSKWDGRQLSMADLCLLSRDMKERYSVDKFSLMGYSLGGRICLAITEHMPEQIDRLVLLSSDGMSSHSFYSFSTTTYLGKRFMNHLVEKPGVYISVLNQLSRFKLIKTSLHTFVLNHLQNKQSREFLRNVWNVTSSLRPYIGRLKSMLNKYRIPVYVFVGQYDTIIPARLAINFVKNLKTAHLTILNCGHRTINTQSIPEIAKTLLD